ncbi:MAG: hypothetical protein AAF456_04565 [Planctomycetota bacterium]
MPRRINPIALYLVSLAISIAAYAGYAQFAVPVIEGPPNIVKQRSDPTADLPKATNETTDKIAWLFHEDSWERKGCNRIMSPQGILLFRDYQPRENGLLDVIPFTMILNPGSESEPPTVLRAEDGARLQLDDSETATLTGSGKLEQAQLAGRVIIYRPPSSDDKDDSLEIITSNVQIDQQRVFALEDVTFRFGRNSGSGRNLAIELINTSTGGPGSNGDLSGIDGFRRIELAFLHNLRLEPSDATVETLQPRSAVDQPGPLSGERSPIEVSCSGAFVFDFEQNMASFNNQVMVREDSATGDNLTCDQLMLYFDEQVPAEPAIEGSTLERDLKLRRMVATGSPARINASSRNSSVEGMRIDYDMLSGEFVASGDDGVVLANPDYRFVAKDIHYKMPGDGTIGPLDAGGPGRMISRAESGPDNPQARPFEATWADMLTIRSLDNGQQLIELDGDPIVQLEAGTRITSDELRLWLWRVESSDTRGNKFTEYLPARMFTEGNVEIQSDQLSGTARQLVATWPGPGTRPVRPVQLPRAVEPAGYEQTPAPQRGFEQQNFEQQNFQQRNFGSGATPPSSRSFSDRGAFGPHSIPENRVSVRRMSWQDAAQYGYDNREIYEEVTPQGTHAVASPASQQSLEPVTSLRQPVSQAGFEQQAQTHTVYVPSATQQQEASPPRRFRFDGDSVEVLLGHMDDGSPVRDLVIDGNVLVNEIQTRSETPLKISGRRMHMVPTTDDMFTLHVTGTDLDQAVVDAGRLRLSGADISLDQAANRIDVDGPGEMSLEGAATGRANYGDETSLDVAWQGSMEFDGRRIHIERDVIMSSSATNPDGSVRQTNSRGTVLDATLVRPVNFRDMESSGGQQPTEIEKLVLLNRAAAQQFQMISHPIAQGEERHPNVVVENKTFDRAGNLTEELQIIVPSATVQGQGNDLQAHGPGSIINRSAGRSSMALSVPGVAQQPTGDGITFVQINFDGPLDARLDENRIRISGNVRTVYSPVADWQSAINPDNPGPLRAGAALLTCERIEVDRWQRRDQPQPTNELRASGNTRIISDEMEITAERLNYDEADGMFVIEGTSRQNAILSYKPAGANSRQNVVGTKILYRPSDQWAHVQGIQDGTISGGRR